MQVYILWHPTGLAGIRPVSTPATKNWSIFQLQFLQTYLGLGVALLDECAASF